MTKGEAQELRDGSERQGPGSAGAYHEIPPPQPQYGEAVGAPVKGTAGQENQFLDPEGKFIAYLTPAHAGARRESRTRLACL